MAYQPQVVGQGEPLKLTSVLREKPPAGAEGIGWHCYVITQGKNTIVGHIQGRADSVKLTVEEIVMHLNERRVGKFSRVHKSPPLPRRKQRIDSQ